MENLYIIIGAFICAVLMGQAIIPNILVISLRKRLFDEPDSRKVHKRPVPRLGGVTFFPVILFTLSVFTAIRIMIGLNPDAREVGRIACEFLFMIGGLTLLYIVGIGDDLVGVFLVGVGYVVILQTTTVWAKALYPADSKGQFEGVRILFFVLIPMIFGSLIATPVIKLSGLQIEGEVGTEYIPNGYIFLVGAIISAFSVIPLLFARKMYIMRINQSQEQ